MVRDRGLAEDLAQETFVKAYRALPTYDTGRKLSSWLFKIAHNTALDHLRRRQLDTVPLQSETEEGADYREILADDRADSPDTRVARSDLRQAFEEAVLELRAEHREVVLLRYQHGMSYQEIVDITGLPLGTVKTNLHRARKALVRGVKERGFEPP